MNKEPILVQLTPPPGGWERLLSRRDRHSPVYLRALPLALAASLAGVVIALQPRTSELQVPWSGGRLVARASEGIGVRGLANGKVTLLPSDDPGVILYWVDEAPPDPAQ